MKITKPVFGIATQTIGFYSLLMHRVLTCIIEAEWQHFTNTILAVLRSKANG